MTAPTVKRWAPFQVKALAKSMKRGDAGQVWFHVSDSIQNAMIDSCVLRAVLSRDEEVLFSVEHIQALRDDLIAELRTLGMRTDTEREAAREAKLAALIPTDAELDTMSKTPAWGTNDEGNAIFAIQDYIERVRASRGQS